MILPQPNHNAVSLAEPVAGLTTAAPIDLTDSDHALPSTVPPHRLWASLEEAFPTSPDDLDLENEQRLPGYVGFLITLILSLSLWALIVGVIALH